MTFPKSVCGFDSRYPLYEISDAGNNSIKVAAMKPSDLGFHPSWDEAVEEAKKKQKKLLSCVWTIGFNDRGMGRGDFAVITKKTGELVVECSSHELAAHIVEVHNATARRRKC